MSRPIRGIFINTILFLTSTAFTVAMLAIGAGFLNRHDRLTNVPVVGGVPQGERLDFCQYDPLLGYDGIPNIQENFQGTAVTQNSFGNRGPEVSAKKAEGVKRILIVGDSQAWGYRVNDSDTIASKLQQALDADIEPGRYEVLNLGASGYGPDQAFLKAISKGLEFEPDHVVLVYFHLNDLFDISNRFAWEWKSLCS